jgi:enamine deaminase RidA (YjgF/YER057c/UK114 family)
MVRIQVHLTDPADFQKVAPVIGKWCREARPANTTVISGLIDPRMKIEIEVTARRRLEQPKDRPGRGR